MDVQFLFLCRQQEGSKGTVADVLRPGTEMVAAGYTMYVSVTSAYYSLKKVL